MYKKKTVENIEHIHFKEKFTKKSVQADSINLRAVGWGKGGHKKTCTTSIPF